MRMILLAALILSPLSTLAASIERGDVSISPVAVAGSSAGASAEKLWAELVEFGVKPRPGLSGRTELIEIKPANVTITNGAACEDGRPTYRAELQVVDAEGRNLQKLELNDSDACRAGTAAERFYEQLKHFGADQLEGDCGLGHCWLHAKSISCYRAQGKEGTRTSCSVISSDGPSEVDAN